MFTLSVANSYTSATTVRAVILRVYNQSSSATETGAVRVNSVTLGGQGIIAGPVTIGTGSGTIAVLSPSLFFYHLSILILQHALTFKAYVTYSYNLYTYNAIAYQFIANLVYILAERSLVFYLSLTVSYPSASSSQPSATLLLTLSPSSSPICPTSQLSPPFTTIFI